MTQLIRASLDLFIGLAVLITFGQDLYRMTYSQSALANPVETTLNSTSENGTASAIPEMTGVVIYVTDNLRKQLTDLLTA